MKTTRRKLRKIVREQLLAERDFSADRMTGGDAETFGKAHAAVAKMSDNDFEKALVGIAVAFKDGMPSPRTVVELLDPTPITSIPEVPPATIAFKNDPSVLNGILFTLAILSAVPVGGKLAKFSSKTLKRLSGHLDKVDDIVPRSVKPTVTKAKEEIEYLIKRERLPGDIQHDIKDGQISRTPTPWRGEDGPDMFKEKEAWQKSLTTVHDEYDYIVKSRKALEDAGLEAHYVKTEKKMRMDGGEQAYKMVKVPGETLGKRLTDGSLSDAERTLIIRQLDSVLDVLHKNDLPHGDLRTRNIMITGEGQNIKAVLIDPAPSRAAGLKNPGGKKDPVSRDRKAFNAMKAELKYPEVHKDSMGGLSREDMIKNIKRRLYIEIPPYKQKGMSKEIERRAKEMFDEYESLQPPLITKEGKMRITRSSLRKLILQEFKSSNKQVIPADVREDLRNYRSRGYTALGFDHDQNEGLIYILAGKATGYYSDSEFRNEQLKTLRYLRNLYGKSSVYLVNKDDLKIKGGSAGIKYLRNNERVKHRGREISSTDLERIISSGTHGDQIIFLRMN